MGWAQGPAPSAAPQKGEEQGIAGVSIDGFVRSGKAPPAEPKALVVEADHEPVDRIKATGSREAGLVCTALEHRELFQGAEVRLQGRGHPTERLSNLMAMYCILAW